jgi:hypothetical protein
MSKGLPLTNPASPLTYKIAISPSSNGRLSLLKTTITLSVKEKNNFKNA